MIRIALVCLFFSVAVFSKTGLEVMELVQMESQKKMTREAVVTMKIFDKDGL